MSPKQSGNPNRLIVEGKDDLLVIAELMGAHINWPDEKDAAPVYISEKKGVEEILQRDFLKTTLKIESLKSLGVVLDADEQLAVRYQKIWRDLYQL